jgi:hypothetical protein
MQGKGAPSLEAHPRKRRFPQTRKSPAAVEILCWNFCGVSNYKASLFDLGQMGLDRDYTFRVNFVTLIGNSLLYRSV